MKKFVDVDAMSTATGLSKQHIRQLVKDGIIPHIMSGNKVLINYELATAVLDELSLQVIEKCGR